MTFLFEGKMIHQIQKYQLQQQQQLWESGSAYAFFLLKCCTAAPAICTFHFSITPGGLGCCISAFAFCMLHFDITFGGPGYCVSWQKFGSEWTSHSSSFLHLKCFSLEMMTFFPLVLALLLKLCCSTFEYQSMNYQWLYLGKILLIS